MFPVPIFTFSSKVMTRSDVISILVSSSAGLNELTDGIVPSTKTALVTPTLFKVIDEEFPAASKTSPSPKVKLSTTIPLASISPD